MIPQQFNITFIHKINPSDYPEAIYHTSNSIVVDADSIMVYPIGKHSIKIFMKGEDKVYDDVDFIAPVSIYKNRL